MLTGIQELLTIGFIIVCLFFLPRLFRGDKSGQHKKIRQHFTVSGTMRVGIVLSLMLPIIMLFIIKPWEGDIVLFMSVGILPVAAGWAGVWVRDGFKINQSGK